MTTARAAVVIEGSKVHFEKNADEKLPIASTTKILTAITVLETYADIDETVTVPALPLEWKAVPYILSTVKN